MIPSANLSHLGSPERLASGSTATEGLPAVASPAALLLPLPDDVLLPDAEGLGFELAYAFNAMGKHDRAVEVATEALDRHDNDYLACRELGYAYFRLSRLEEAAKTYTRCLAGWPEGEREIKAEVAVNLAGVYKGLGAAQQCREWLDKAFEWVPSGSPRRAIVDRMRQTSSTCAS